MAPPPRASQQTARACLAWPLAGTVPTAPIALPSLLPASQFFPLHLLPVLLALTAPPRFINRHSSRAWSLPTVQLPLLSLPPRHACTARCSVATGCQESGVTLAKARREKETGSATSRASGGRRHRAAPAWLAGFGCRTGCLGTGIEALFVLPTLTGCCAASRARPVLPASWLSTSLVRHRRPARLAGTMERISDAKNSIPKLPGYSVPQPVGHWRARHPG